MNENFMSDEELQRQVAIPCLCNETAGTCGPCLAENELLRRRRETLAGLLPKGCYCHELEPGLICIECFQLSRVQERVEEEDMSKVKPEFPEGMFTSGEEKSIALKLYGMFKQHIHNDLGVTKEYIDKIIVKTTEERRKELEARYQKLPEDIAQAISEKIGYTAEGGPTDWFKAQVRKIILGEINEAIKGSRVAGEQISTFQEFVRKTVEGEIRKIIVSKLKVDIKLDLIEPKEGELRELIGPEDNFRGVREV